MYMNKAENVRNSNAYKENIISFEFWHICTVKHTYVIGLLDDISNYLGIPK